MDKQEKKLWNIFHQYQNYDGNFMEDLVGTVLATEEEVETFREKWSKGKRGEDGMIYGIVYAEEVMPNSSLETLIPYYDEEEDNDYDYEHELFLQGRAWDI